MTEFTLVIHSAYHIEFTQKNGIWFETTYKLFGTRWTKQTAETGIYSVKFHYGQWIAKRNPELSKNTIDEIVSRDIA